MKNKSLLIISTLMICLISFPGYSIDMQSICNRMITDPDFDTFLNLREFFKANPSFVQRHNPDDEAYCKELKEQFKNFPKQFTNAIHEENIHKNCVNLNETEISSEYESFKTIKYAIRRCQI